jgi:5-methylcytosine-specific restriction endonuclease McrA
VEDFPLLPLVLEDAEQHHNYLKECLRSGFFPSGEKLNAKKRAIFESEIKNFKKSEYPDKIPSPIAEASCRVFGHLCPVFFVGEPLTETKSMRRHSRTIPREVMLKVVRRDGQICQRCFKPVPDDQVEFDHVIPFSKGGNTTADNLKLCCRTCNRKKTDSLTDILSPNPIEHLVVLRKKQKKP